MRYHRNSPVCYEMDAGHWVFCMLIAFSIRKICNGIFLVIT